MDCTVQVLAGDVVSRQGGQGEETGMSKQRNEHVDKEDVVEYLEGIADHLADKLVDNPDNERAMFDRTKIENAIDVLKSMP